MKKLITLFSVLLTLSVVGQDFVSGTKYLQGKTMFSGYSVSELTVTRTNGDSTFMEYDGIQYSYFKDKLYMEDSLLFFDFSSNEGDTLVYNNRGFRTKIRVDSIRDIMLDNGLLYKHYFAHDILNRGRYTIIKGIGEKSFGLNLFYAVITIPEFVGVISVCINDSLIYWLSTKPPTCDFDSLVDLGIGNINKQSYFPYTLYPNPAHDVLYLEGVEQADIRILDVLGAELYNGVYENSLDVSKFSSGVYFLEFMKNKTMYRTKFYKE